MKVKKAIPVIKEIRMQSHPTIRRKIRIRMSLVWLVFILGPFARSGLFPLLVTAAYGSHHVNPERKILALRSKI